MRNSKILKIGEILIKKQFCTPEQIKEALGIQRQMQIKRLGTILVDLAYVTKDQMLRVLEDQWENSFKIQKIGKK
jgi:hypothetical protein